MLQWQQRHMSRSCSIKLLPCFSMSSRLGATLSPISRVKMRLASTASSMVSRRRVRVFGFIVVDQSCSGIISPRPCMHITHQQHTLPLLQSPVRLSQCIIYRQGGSTKIAAQQHGFHGIATHFLQQFMLPFPMNCAGGWYAVP